MDQLKKTRVRTLILLLCAACTGTVLGETKFATEYLHRMPGSINVIQLEASVVFEIRNETGIGKGNINRLEGQWPERAIVRLYLKGLEGFSASSTDLKLEKHELSIEEFNSNGLHYYGVELPASLLAENESIHINWIDFYR